VAKLTVTDINNESASSEVTVHVIALDTLGATLDQPLVMIHNGTGIYETRNEDDIILSYNSAEIRMVQSDVADEDLGYALAITKEGTLVIGTPSANDGRGKVYFSKTPLDSLSGDIDLSTEDSLDEFEVVLGAEENDHLGTYAATGDINGDDVDEIFVVAPDAGEDDQGEIYIYDSHFDLIGTVSGSDGYCATSVFVNNYISAVPDDLFLGPDHKSLNANLQRHDAPQEANMSQHGFLLSGETDFEEEIDIDEANIDAIIGDDLYQAAALGDINHDDEDDLALASSDGTISLFFGPIEMGTDLSEEDADVMITDGEVLDGFGKMLTIGDVTGDGIEDIIVGAPDYGDNLTGAVFVIFGRMTWPSSVSITSDTTLLTVLGESANDQIGGDFLLGDLNNNGVNELYTTKGAHDVYRVSLLVTAPGGSYELRGTNGGCGYSLAQNINNNPKQQISPFVLILIFLYTLVIPRLCTKC